MPDSPGCSRARGATERLSRVSAVGVGLVRVSSTWEGCPKPAPLYKACMKATDEPVADNRIEEGRAKNRRVELVKKSVELVKKS